MEHNTKPTLYTCASPALLHLYDLNKCTVVVIDVLRATSTIACALYNGAACVIPVDSVAECIRIGTQIDGITAGERDGKIAEGLAHGNSPSEYPRQFIENKNLVLTTTNGTKLLHMALQNNAQNVITGSFPNLSAVAQYLIQQHQNVILGCSAWKDKLNVEDLMFAGAVISKVKQHFNISCDTSLIAEMLYQSGKSDLFDFMKSNHASHYERLHNFGVDDDMRTCLTEDTAPIVPLYVDGKLVVEQQ
jgi:2-phosphosulfolactate phosphatase